jgi:uncharacterized protein YkwD
VAECLRVRLPSRLLPLAAACAAACLSGPLAGGDALAAAPLGRSAGSTPGHHRSTPQSRRRCHPRARRRDHRPACRARSRAKLHPRAHRTTTPSATQSTAAAVAAVLATPCVETEILPQPDNVALARAAVLCLVNRVRAQNGEAPLRPSQRLDAAAEGHNAEMIAQDYFAHVSPGGETPVARVRQAGYIPSPLDGYVIGENLAWGTYQLATPQAIVAAWIASPEHLANILEAKYTETGIGVYPAVPASLSGGAPGATYAQEFGVIVA